ncbi:hypothetical protein E2F43_08695 [Seongchinamella unica]|uniref:Uncharacterized protein n=1 Tax=Seongchinamella unica TaxID=2547392 RepID=A0A4R5LRT2_9GAMM|nr:hypothetical protein [Seongchinamella unica]TDG13598.1 hypothetical protein E2F43_08695 [Seongchinamella unica]
MTDGKQAGLLGMDWRVAFGLAVTLIWISAGLVYLVSIVGLDSFVHLPTADIGSFLEGAFAPLAFLWLVIGHFMQQKEISANTRAISIQEQSARRLEVHSQRDSYFKLHDLVQDQLGAIAAFHYMSVCGPTGTGEITGEEFTEQRHRAATGDNSFFIRKMIAVAVNYREDMDKLCEIFFGTAVRRRHSETFAHTFGKLLKTAQAVDTDDMIADALLNGSAAGLLYRIIQHVRGEEGIGPLMGFPIKSDLPLPGQEPSA